MDKGNQVALRDAVILPMTDDSRIAEARRLVKNMTRELGFTQVDTERAAIVVTEAASNLMKYAQQGRLIIRPLSNNILEILAVDNGPGIANVPRVMEDGYSTANSKGIGLGAIARLSSAFHIYSIFGVGTALLIQLWSTIKENPLNLLEVAVVSTPKPLEKLNGDASSVVYQSEKVFFLLVDGLGHGPEAAAASQKAVETFDKVVATSPKEFITAIDANLKGTRGAAVAVAEVNFAEQHIRFAGVGNINTVLVTVNKNQNMVSQPGIVGQQMRMLQEFVYSWKDLSEPLLIMHTDGMEKRWHLDNYPGLARMPVSLIAGMLFAKHTRGYDDIAVLVSRIVQP